MMQFHGIAAVFAVVAILCLLAGYKLLSSSSWIGGWLRGNIGIFCILLTGLFALCVLDVRSYKPMFDEKTVATLSLREISSGQYEARIVDAMGVESRYSVAGDSWYLSANQFRWSKRLSLGMGHGYRFNKIIGVSNKTTNAEAGDVMSPSPYFDIWKVIDSYFPNNFLVSTAVVITIPEPLADAAMYEVIPSGSDLIVKPMNEFAKRAQALLIQPDALPSGAVIEPDAQATPNAADLPGSNTPATISTIQITPATQDKTLTTQ